MLLEPNDSQLYFRLHRTLMFFVNQRLHLVPDGFDKPDDLKKLPPEVLARFRDAVIREPVLIADFVRENPAGLPDEELEIVSSWQHVVFGDFYIFRYLKKYTVFLSSGEPTIAYGVLALTDPIERFVGPYLPVLVQTALLPFKGQIICDGLLAPYHIAFGPGIRSSLNESFKEAKEQRGIVTSLPVLPFTPAPVPARAVSPPRPRAPAPASGASKLETARALEAIMALVDPFCREHLTHEYASLCRTLAERLARKKPSPLVTGKPNSWAAGIVRTIGWVNSLDDPSEVPHMPMFEVDRAFGVSESTGEARSIQIRRLYKIRPMDPDWSLGVDD